MVHEQGAGQVLHLLRIQLQQRTARTTFGRITELRRRSARQRSRQRSASKDFGRPCCRGVCGKRLFIEFQRSAQAKRTLRSCFEFRYSYFGHEIGLVGFEPTACRRGDRSTILCRAPPYLDRFCNIARVALLPNGRQSFHCGLGSTAIHVWLPLTRQRYAAECGQPNPRKIPRSVVRFSGCAGRNNKTFFGHRRSCRAGGI
jgi:hypothetical protein